MTQFITTVLYSRSDLTSELMEMDSLAFIANKGDMGPLTRKIHYTIKEYYAEE